MPRKSFPASALVPPISAASKEGAAAAVAAEQQRIADWLHQSVGQTITGARFLISAMERTAGSDGKTLARDLKTLQKQLAQASEELHELIKSLRSERPG
ncbi:MAG: histidine kinase [Chthoniobacteraceae bacterium]